MVVLWPPYTCTYTYTYAYTHMNMDILIKNYGLDLEYLQTSVKQRTEVRDKDGVRKKIRWELGQRHGEFES